MSPSQCRYLDTKIVYVQILQLKLVSSLASSLQTRKLFAFGPLSSSRHVSVSVRFLFQKCPSRHSGHPDTEAFPFSSSIQECLSRYSDHPVTQVVSIWFSIQKCPSRSSGPPDKQVVSVRHVRQLMAVHWPRPSAIPGLHPPALQLGRAWERPQMETAGEGWGRLHSL